MKKRLLSLLLIFVLVLGMLPASVFAVEADVAGLKMTTDLQKEYLLAQKSWSTHYLTVEAKPVDASGNEVSLPEGATISYQWYKSTDDKIDDSDTKVGTNAKYGITLNSMAIAYYYVIAKVTVKDVEYTATSTVSCVKIGAANISVTFTVNNKGTLAADKDGNVAANVTVSVQDLNADGKHTYDEALIALHKALKSEKDYVTKESSFGGLAVSKLWGVETSNCLFFKNGEALKTTVDAVTVAGNDVLYVSINKDDTYYADKYTKFDVSAKAITKGHSVELTLTDGNGKALAGIAIGTWKDGKFVAMEGKVTDQNGKVTLTFPEAGTYMITAQGSVKEMVNDYSAYPTVTQKEADCPLMAPVCTVNVKNPGELKLTQVEPDYDIKVKVGENASELNSFVGVTYYIDGKVDYTVKATTEWYRINKSGNGVAEKVESIRDILTEADEGQWQYYMYAYCDAYGERYSVRSDYFDVTVRKAELPKGEDPNGWVSNIADNGKNFVFEKGKTDYVLYIPEGKTTQFNVTAVPGKNLWVGYWVNGIKDMKSPSYNTSAKEMTVTSAQYINMPNWFEVGSSNVFSIYVGPKVDTDGNGAINIYDRFTGEYAVYNFTIVTVPSMSSVAVKDADGKTVTLTGNSKGSTDIYGSTDSDIIKLTANFSFAKGVKLYVGNSEAYIAKLTDVEISLAQFRDENGVANIPVKLVWEGEDGKTVTYTQTLHISPATDKNAGDFDPPVITTQPKNEVSVNKGETVKLTVGVEKPAKGTLSYQWVSASYSSYFASGNYTVIEGATGASYDAPALESIGVWTYRKFYACLVTLTIDGKTVTTMSDYSEVTTKLSKVNDPIITVQPGLGGNKNGSGVYKTTYTAGSAFDPMWLAVQSESYKYPDAQKSGYITELGCNPYEVHCYYNSTASVEGATELTGEIVGSLSGGTFGRYFSFTPDEGLPEGEWYIFYKIVTTSKEDSSLTASTYTDFVKLTYNKAQLGMEGTGTEEDPFLIATTDHMLALQNFVNSGAGNCSGMHFKLVANVDLPVDWAGIGISFGDGRRFSGVLDGNGYQINLAEGSQPLFQYCNMASIKNLKLYGKKIQGDGALIGKATIYQVVGAYIAKIDNVTLVSGSSTYGSGFLRGSASSFNPVYISNSTIEEDVIIGYEKNQIGIGSFAGCFTGTIENCTSAATVYGVNHVGGIAGSRANAMGYCTVTNCSFTGEVIASGNYVGGIFGGGYSSNSAPNGMCVGVQNCFVSGTVTGDKCVGGIFGGEGGIQQAWDNGIGRIQNNVFYGTINGNENVGGIIGYMASLNKGNVIRNNYYYDTNGCKTPIGGVEHIDTSTHEFGMGEDGIFYYDTSRDSLDDIKDFVDAEDKGTSDWQYTSVSGKNNNRNDDPMGKDKDGLGKACTEQEMKDGSIVKLLNAHEDSLKNWVQGEKSPKLSNEVVITGIEISGDYQKAFDYGTDLDLTGIVITIKYSNGTTKTVTLEDVTITGYDKNTSGSQKLTLTYESATTDLTVTVKPQSNKITVNIQILGDSAHGKDGGTHGLTMGGLTSWVEEINYAANANESVWDVLKRVFEKHDITADADDKNAYNTIYIKALIYKGVKLAELTNGENSGWMFTINGKHPDVGVSATYLKQGDVIVLHYTDDYTKEQDDLTFDDERVKTVFDMISDLGKITLESEAAIEKARQAYDSLSEEQKKKVTNADILKTAEKKLAELKDNKSITDRHEEDGKYIQNLGTPSVGSIGGEWAVIGLLRSGLTVSDDYYEAVVKYVKENIDENSRLHWAKSTDNSRIILALTALGKDVTNVGGYNLLLGLNDMAYIQKQGLNGPIWALIALDSGNYVIPQGDVTREKLVQVILDAQLADGGWALSGNAADADMTGMALQALATYYNSNINVRSAVDKAIETLSSMQNEDGTFSAFGGNGGRVPTSESTAQIVVALTALGINPHTDARFIKNGNSAVDGLLSFTVEGGGFKHLADGALDGMATEQGYYALTAYSRFVNGQKSLYNMTDVVDQGAYVPGAAVKGIVSIVKTKTDGLVDTYTITFTDGTTTTFTITNGADGSNGANGSDGKDGITPKLRINAETNMWEVSYDNGKTWISLGVQATGDKGDKGDTGATGDKGDKGDTGAAGTNGTNGVNGKDGENADNSLVVAAVAIAGVSLVGNIALALYVLMSKKKRY